MDYKDTLNLPKTEFPMKANLSQKELEFLPKFKNLYKKLFEERKNRELFVLHDGPPYANGHIHVGHALNKILKDIIVKFNLILGKRVHYVPGWDCHGLPIEQQVEKELKAKKINKESIPKHEFRKLCRDYALKFVNIQKEEFLRLGILGDWDNSYLTMTPSYEAQEIRELGRCFKNGHLYKSKKPVYWCTYDKTAEAEAEVEYQLKKDPSIYVLFEILDQKFIKEKLYALIWTTTPWTLPANLGIMVSKDLNYCIVKYKDIYFISSKNSASYLEEKLKEKLEIIRELKGEELIGLTYKHPFIERQGKIYPSEFIEEETGTGIVHMAPGHGQEDYVVGLRFGLEPFSPLDDEGKFTSEAPDFIQGKRVFEANDIIIDKLKELGNLLLKEEIEHSYPHCWRCKNPVIYRATPQWFISMKNIRDKALEEIEKTIFIPLYGKNRIRSMVENRPDWCISRQRYWGVPIAIFYCKNCGEPLLDENIFNHIANLIEKDENASDVWFDKTEKELLPEGVFCKNCGSKEFVKENDILDVWFDSGSSHASVLRKRNIEKADIYLEGSDQHRGWFQASLLESISSYGNAPFKGIITHGFTVDEKGRKMSKSLGNVISPFDIIKDYGADILRLWVVSEDYTEDLKLGKNILNKLSDDYRKIRNTIRFCLGNLYDFDISKALNPKDLFHFDRWMYSFMAIHFEEVIDFYKSYQFHRIYHKNLEFINVYLSSIYFDVLKDRLYVYKSGSFERISAQTVLFELVKNLIITFSPILSFTALESWDYLKKIDNSLRETPFEQEYKKIDFFDEDLLEDYGRLLVFRKEVLRALEIARKEKLIGHPYEAKVIVNSSLEGLLDKYIDYIPFFLTVSQFELDKNIEGIEGEQIKDLKIRVEKAKGKKCPRCWIFFEENYFEGEICKRCAKNINYI